MRVPLLGDQRRWVHRAPSFRHRRMKDLGSAVGGPTGPAGSARRLVGSARSAAENHPVALPFGVALVVRVVAAVGITALQHGYLFPDESAYVDFGGLAASGHLTLTTDAGYGEVLFHEAASFMWPVTVLFKVFGPHVIVAALWAGLFGAVTAALVSVFVGQALSHGWATLAGLVVAVFPSQVLWSSVVLRESMVWASLAAAALGVAGLARARRWPGLVAWIVLVGTSLLALGYLREWAFLAAAWSVAIAVWLFRPARPVVVRSSCFALCVLIPILPGLGLAGSTYVSHEGGNLGLERTTLSANAKSAFVHPKVIKPPTTKPATTKPATTPATTVATVPTALSDEDLVVPKGIKNDLRALPTGLVAFALRPFPWQHGDGLSYDLAAVEELLYYPLYLLAVVGLVAYRRRREIIAFPIVVVGLISGIAAEAEGNLGSAFRHRDQLFWAVAFFATLGANYLWGLWRRPKTSEEELLPVPGEAQLLTVQAGR